MTKPQQTPFSKSAFTNIIEKYDTILIPVSDKKGNVKFIKKETKIAQILYFIKIMAVIKSCKTLIQLENAFKWFDKVALINSFPHKHAYVIIKAYRKKKQQIQKILAKKTGAANGNTNSIQHCK